MILYHYCSNEAFLSILRTHELRLSDLSLSNDQLEGKWIPKLLKEHWAKQGLYPLEYERLITHVDSLIDTFVAGGFCLSEEGDLLSQWRGYADNGAGVSVGFEASYLEKIRGEPDQPFLVELRQVVYDNEGQEHIIAPFLQEISKAIAAGALRDPEGTLLTPTTDGDRETIKKAFGALIVTFINMVPQLYVLKNPAFCEEREWRLLSHILRGTEKIFADPPVYMDFFAKPDRIVPFHRILLPKRDECQIARVVLGPRNITSKDVVRAALSKYGFLDVEIMKSLSSYR